MNDPVETIVKPAALRSAVHAAADAENVVSVTLFRMTAGAVLLVGIAIR